MAGAYALIIIIFIILFYLYSHRKENITIGRYNYAVYSKFQDKEKAAELLDEIHNRILKLLAHLKKKHNVNLKDNINDGRPYNNDMEDKIVFLLNNYNPDNLRENYPSFKGDSTSYSENKGEVLAICLRNKKTKELHDINTLMFVVLHEIAHLMTLEAQHVQPFWDNFSYLLRESDTIGIYKPVNYAKKPVVYCGMTINSSPIY